MARIHEKRSMEHKKSSTPDGLQFADSAQRESSAARLLRYGRDEIAQRKTRQTNSPTPEDVRAIRVRVQAAHALGNVTAAQSVCAEACGTSLRTWIQWEAGTRRMHRDFWDLAQSKLGSPDD
jgi:hypothetical protein